MAKPWFLRSPRISPDAVRDFSNDQLAFGAREDFPKRAR
jgi:hypothetical protein